MWRKLLLPLVVTVILSALLATSVDARTRRHWRPRPDPTPTPVATPTPNPTQPPATTGGLPPVGYTVVDLSPVVDFSVAGDQGIVMLTRTDRYKLWGVVPEHARGVAVTTIDGVEAKLASLPYRVSWLVYDIENWDLTSDWEKANPPEATRQARAIADRYGAKLAVVPTLGIARQYGTRMAPYAHVFKVQSKGLQATSTPQEFGAILNPLYDSLRAANPNMKVYADISPAPKGVQMTPDQLLAYWNAVKDHAQGISAWVTSSENEATFGAFLDKVGR